LEEIKKHYGNCGEVEICRFRYLIEKEDWEDFWLISFSLC
jgi:hypothetical protein